MPDVLIELFSEEIPARMQPRAAEDLKRLVTEALVQAGLTYAGAQGFATPRRLTLAITGLTAHSPDQTEERKGPRVDAPPAAIDGFLRATGLTLDQLEIRDDKKAQVYVARMARPGRPAAVILAEALDATVRNFPWPKSMRWGSGSLRWVRPLRSILCLMTTEAGAEVVPLSIDGIEAAATTCGHRFMAPAAFAVTGFDDYAARLKRAFVILDPAERAARIEADIAAQAFALGLELVPDPALLTEVAGLVEWPVVLVGQIEERFLSLPPEVLQTSMREHQKFFSLRDPATGRIVRFVTVANTETRDGGALVLAGNQKVLAARLSDAMFFWENDNRFVRQMGMDGWTEALSNVTFHNKLGSQKDRISRIEALARELAPMVGANPDLAAQAARLAKADLRSAMVGEFPELQGTMGTYYARAAGLPDAVALACREHYQPLGPSDDVPTNPVSVAVALADKIDTLTGFWAIDEKPTGSKDPFALRRAALGVIRLVLGNGVRVALEKTISYFAEPQIWNQIASRASEEEVAAVELFEKQTGLRISEVTDPLNEVLQSVVVESGIPIPQHDLLSFLHDRLKVFLRDQGIRHDVIDACLAMPGNDDLTLLVKRATALAAVLKSDDGANMLQGFKRANKLWMDEMKKEAHPTDDAFLKAIRVLENAETEDGVEYSFGPDRKFAETPEEFALFDALDHAEAAIAKTLAREDFTAAMTAMAALRAPIDAFFTAVQINAENPILRRNRLNLLHRIRATCARVADLSRIEG